MIYQETNGSLILKIDGERTSFIPKDESSEEYRLYLEAVAAGLVPLPAPAADYRTPLLTAVREARELVLNRLSGIGLAAVANADTATLDAVMTARQALLDITTAPSVVAATTEAELRAALVAKYAAIVAAAPPGLVNVFAEFNL